MSEALPQKNFSPSSIQTFRFVSYDFDEETSTASLHYAFDQTHSFTETYTFKGTTLPLDPQRRRALDRSLSHLHLMAGISYFKAAVPSKITVENTEISKETADFFEKCYLHGLGEFAFCNDLDLQGKIKFPASQEASCSPIECPLPRKTIVPVGGGKDSIVTIEALKQAGEPMALFSVGAYQPILDVVDVAGLEYLQVQRKIDPKLFELNAQGAYNGHVPISAIIAFVLAVSANLYGFDRAALSNERSANVGNLQREDGFEVNHQYSKGLEFEKDLGRFLVADGNPAFRYFSFLRPLSELHIAQLFARSTQYHPVFTSCNKAFRIQKEAPSTRWCLDCPKCRFTFLAIAPALPKDALIQIYGKNLLDDPTQTTGFDELIGVSGHKPFECVGEVEESIAAMLQLAETPSWREDLLVARFKTQLLPKLLPSLPPPQALIKQTMTPSTEHHLPLHFEELLHAYL